MQYRIGKLATSHNVPAGYLADAINWSKSGNCRHADFRIAPGSGATFPNLQFRIITTNAAGSDEWVGIDDITVTSTAIHPPGIYVYGYSFSC